MAQTISSYQNLFGEETVIVNTALFLQEATDDQLAVLRWHPEEADADLEVKLDEPITWQNATHEQVLYAVMQAGPEDHTINLYHDPKAATDALADHFDLYGWDFQDADLNRQQSDLFAAAADAFEREPHKLVSVTSLDECGRVDIFPVKIHRPLKQAQAA